jgi:hypothetical protein
MDPPVFSPAGLLCSTRKKIGARSGFDWKTYFAWLDFGLEQEEERIGAVCGGEHG